MTGLTTEQAAQLALDKRGYLVIGTYQPRSIGEVTDIQTTRTPGFEASDAKAVVTQETTREDMIAQEELFQHHYPNVRELPYYYRCIAE